MICRHEASGDGRAFLAGRDPRFVFGATSFRVILLRGYGPSFNENHTVLDLSPFEIAGDGYGSSGQELTEVERVLCACGRVSLDASDVAWNGTIFTDAAVVIGYRYEEVWPVAYNTFGGLCGTARGTLTIIWNELGIVTTDSESPRRETWSWENLRSMNVHGEDDCV